MLKIKTLITYLCSLIIADSVAVEIFAIGQPCAKIFRKVYDGIGKHFEVG